MHHCHCYFIAFDKPNIKCIHFGCSSSFILNKSKPDHHLLKFLSEFCMTVVFLAYFAYEVTTNELNLLCNN
jgi:hypothetical protein